MDITLVLNSIVGVLWIVVIGLIALSVVRASRGAKVRSLSAVILVTAILAVVLTSLSAGLVFIQPEERGVVISAVAPQGYREVALQPGLNWIIPFLERVVIYPISRQTYTMSIVPTEGSSKAMTSIAARTADGQEVLIDSSVIYAVDPKQVVTLHINWQDRYAGDLVRPLSRGVIRDAVSQFGVEEVYSSKRNELKLMITTEMGTKMDDNGLILIDFVLRNITFSPEYAASVEQKQIAEQQAQQAFFVVEQRKQEAEQARQVAQGKADAVVIASKGDAEARLIQAEAESSALELIQQSLKDNPELLNYTFIQKMGSGVQTIFLPSDVPYLLPLPGQNSAATPNLQQLVPTPLPTPVP